MRQPTSLLDRLFGIDLRSLAFLRIILGAMCVLDVLGRYQDLEAHYGPHGVFPFNALQIYWGGSGNFWAGQGPLWAWATPYALDSSTEWAAFLLTVHLIAALILMVGWQSRFAAFLTWFMICAVHNRNPIILHGGDQMLRILTFWAMFLPIGARWSVDGACATLKAYGQEPPARTLSVGSAGLLIQTIIIYWATASLKRGREWLQDGTALYYALGIQQYRLPLGRWAFGLPLPLLKAGNWASIALEWIGPVVTLLPFWRLRTAMFFVFFLFHVVLIAPMMDVGPISYVSALLWVPFLPGEFWDKIGAWWGRRRDRGLVRAVNRLVRGVTALRDRRIARRVAARKPLPQLAPSLPMQMMAAFWIVFIAHKNLANSMPVLVPRYPLGFGIAQMVRQDQYWGMFAPRPLPDDGWYIVAARKTDGTTIDLFRGGAPVRWERPDDINATYANARWCKLYMNLWYKSNAVYREYLVHWLRYDWMRRHPNEMLDGVTVYFNYEPVPPPGQPRRPAERTPLWSDAPGQVNLP